MLRIANDVAWVQGEADAYHVMRLPAGTPITLAGTAASVWRIMVIEGGDADDVASHYGVATSEISSTVAEFLAQLVRGGFVKEA